MMEKKTKPSPKPRRLEPGQSSMEYLATYGWALLAIVIVLGVLYLITPLSAPELCQFQDYGFSCSGQRFIYHDPNSDVINVVYAQLANSGHSSIHVLGMACLQAGSPAPRQGADGHFLERAFTIPESGENKPLILNPGQSVNMGSLPNNPFKLECFKQLQNGSLQDVDIPPGGKFTGDIYVLYRGANDPAFVPSALTSGKLSSSVQ